jgi:hypothetical protein
MKPKDTTNKFYILDVFMNTNQTDINLTNLI